MEERGVYILYGKDKEVLYVGKATSPSQRLEAHRKDIDFKSYSIIPTTSEREALLLEANLIKKYRPVYNIKLRDDKAYPFIKVTLGEEFPRFLVVRRIEDSKSRYFGPYTDSKSLRDALRILREYFKIRTCRRKQPYRKAKPCLRYQINQCYAPCCGFIDKEEYKKNVEEACLFLSGKCKKLLNLWEKEMKRYAENLEYEAARIIRDRIIAVKHISSSQRVVFSKPIALDALGIEVGTQETIVVLCIVREGLLQGVLRFDLSSPAIISKESAEEEFLKQYYLSSGKEGVVAFSLLFSPPEEILIPYQLKDESIPLSFYSLNRCKIVVPKKNTKKYKILEFAQDYANRLAKERNLAFFSNALEELKELLNLTRLPHYIIMVDLATLAGSHNCGAIVSFKDGIPYKSGYRRFKIKKEMRSDLALLEDVLKRYFSSDKYKLPDLLIIDGGKAHINYASKILKEMGKEVELMSFAKQEEKIYVKRGWKTSGGKTSKGDIIEELELDPQSNAFNLLRCISNEAHRFVHSYFHKLHKKYLGI